MYNQWRNFSPRVGVAWDVRGDGRTSIRTAAGTFYDYPAAIYQRSLTTVPPWNQRIQLFGVRFEDPWAGYPGGDPGNLPFGGNVPSDIPWQLGSIATAMDYDTPNMRVAQWNFSVQQQLGTNWVASANYIGNATRHLWTTRPINPVLFVPGVGDTNGNCSLNGQTLPFKVQPGAACSTSSTSNLAARRRLALDSSIPPNVSKYFGPINKIDAGGTASYNGLVLSMERRPVRGLSLSGNYTWSHCITDYWQEVANSPNADEGWQDPNNRNLDRGNCTTGAQDRRHIFNLSAVAETPQFSSTTLRVIGSGWRLSPIVKILSGSFLTITSGRDTALSSWGNQRVDLLLANPYGDKSVGNYLNPRAFTRPAPGALGNLGVGAIEGPGTWQFDVALSRTFRFGETQRVEFRSEAFNLTNSFRMENPTTNFNSGTFGQVITARDPRIMQFALKYSF